MTSPPDGQLYTSEEVAARISARLGEPVAPGQVRLGVHRSTTRANARMRPTAGMPNPLPLPQDGSGDQGRRVWDASQIETWLESHPRLRRDRLLEDLRLEVTASESRRAEAVLRGKRAGLSWAQLAALLADVDGVPISRQAVARKYTPLLDDKQ